MSKQAAIKANYAFAVINGYTETYATYARNAYNGYCQICKRCGIKPMSQTQWASN